MFNLVTLSNIPIGTYTISEEDIVRYVKQATQNATVTDGGTAKVYFKNELKKGNIKIQKNCEDNLKSGLTFNVTRSDGSSYNAATNSDGIAELNNLPVYDSNNNKITYTVQETNIPVRYVTTDNQTVILEPDKTSSLTFNNILKKFRVTVTKSDIEKGHSQGDAKLSGAVYGIYKGEQLIDTYSTDENGQFTTQYYVCADDWTIREITASEGYKFLINNANFESYLKVVKLDKETGKQIAYEGAAFEIYDNDNHRISMQFTYPKVTTIHTFYTNSEGYLITPEKLPYGDYTLVEVQAPYGYVLDSTPIPFTIIQENSSTDTGVTVVKVKARDMAQKGVIEITKEGEIFSSVGMLGGGYVDENGNDIEFPITYSPIYETKHLANAVFQIYAAEDITTLDGTLRYYQEELVDEITTEANGVAKSKELYLGKYTVIEKTAPNGYVNANEQYNVELTYAGQNVSVTSTALTVNNDRQKVTVSLEKALEKDKLFNIGDNDEILSVQFGIFADEDITAADSSVIPKNALITFANCDIDGKITFNCDLPIGCKFYAKEMSVDEHYILSNARYTFDTEYQGQEIKTIEINLNSGQKIENKLKRGNIKGFKTDRETGETIEGALFGLFNSDETEFTEDNAILTAESDKDGVFIFENIPYGNWIICELKAADGYLENAEIHHVQINSNEQVVTLNIVNDRIPELKTTATVDGEKEICATEIFTLTDTVEYKHLIPDKEYALKGVLMDKNTGKALVIDGKEITSEVTFTPDEPSGTVDVLFTFDSKYIKEETNLVVFESLYKDGQELAVHADIDDEDQTVTVKIPEIKTTAKAGGKKTVTAKGEITIDDTVKYTNLTPGKEYVIKGILMDKTTGKPFKVNGKEIKSEVKFIPEKSNGTVTVTFTFDSSAIAKETELVVFETLYRDGVEIAVHADIKDEGQTVTVKIPAPKTPKTGDDRSYGTLIGIAAVALGGIISAVILRVKSKKAEDDD